MPADARFFAASDAGIREKEDFFAKVAKFRGVSENGTVPLAIWGDLNVSVFYIQQPRR
jgi:hypothetical protein